MGRAAVLLTIVAIFSLFQNFSFLDSQVPGPRLAPAPGTHNPSYSDLPETPAFDANIIPVLDGKHTLPHVPPYRTTSDGRVGVGMTSFGVIFNGSARNRATNVLAFKLFVPENIRSPFMMSAPGVAGILNQRNPALATLGFHLPVTDLASKGIVNLATSKDHSADPRYRNLQGLAMVTMCDPPAARNPSACGIAANRANCGCSGANCAGKDVYEVFLVSALRSTESEYKESKEFRLRLLRVPLRIVVRDAKTARAKIEKVEVSGPAQMGPLWHGKRFFEPMITEDGKLLVFRAGNNAPAFEADPQYPVTWYNQRTKSSQTGVFDIAFSVNPDSTSASACDIRKWTSYQPISHAHHHPVTRARYGFAKMPFRYSTGELIEDGADAPYTYPWMDRAGRNLFFTYVSANLVYPDRSNPSGPPLARYLTACVPKTSCEVDKAEEDSSRKRGVSMVGLWTLGKIVLLDGYFNATDYGMGYRSEQHRVAALYRQPGTGVRVFERIGSGIEIADSNLVQDDSGRFTRVKPHLPAGFPGNSAFIDSIENRFNFNDFMKPISPRDVVWTMSNGNATDEVVFDDFMDTTAYIVSDMNAPFLKTQAFYYGDGFTGNQRDGHGMRATAFIQNAAGTPSSVMEVPKYGYLVKGADAAAGRIEPVAKGGFRGKGLWLSGQNALVYPMPSQTKRLNRPLYLSLMIDSRMPMSTATEHALFHHPSGLSVYLTTEGSEDRWFLRFSHGGRVVQAPTTVRLRSRAWSHLGLRFLSQGGATEVRIESNAMTRKTLTLPFAIDLFQSGPLIFGARAGDARPGFRGWIDDLKVFAADPHPEVRCNYAYGTIVGVLPGGPYQGMGTNIEKSWHDDIRGRLPPRLRHRYTHFACHQNDLRDRWGGNRFNIRAGTESLRERLLFPEGPLRFGHARPDSLKNEFCLTCHRIPASVARELSPSALAPARDGRAMEFDLRRQPLQPPRLLRGWVTNEVFGGHQAPLAAPTTNVLIDKYLHP